jgi:RNA polymerase sigma-70 factor (ECF subfamily)
MKLSGIKEEKSVHNRLLEGDRSAPKDAFLLNIKPIITFLIKQLRCQYDVAYDSAVDSIMVYLSKPGLYNPERGRLITFLRQIARRRAIERLRACGARARREKNFSDAVAIHRSATNINIEDMVVARIAWAKIKDRLGKEDYLFLRDWLVEVPRIRGRKPAEKKQHDRLMKIIRRFGKKLM